MNAVPAVPQIPAEPMTTSELAWADIVQRAPRMAATMASYLEQLSVSLRPGSVVATEVSLRHLAQSVIALDPKCISVAAIERRHIENHKRWLAARPGKNPMRLSNNTIRHRLGLLRTFFERIKEWGYDDAPTRALIFPGDFPQADERLPKFLDDPTAAKFMAALAKDPNQRRRLMVELLARTGMRVGELSGLTEDAMVLIGDTHWLRVPIGKLHNDRYVPLHPTLVDLITAYRLVNRPSRSGRLVERDDGQPFDKRTVHRYVERVAKRAGVGHVHPHQLRHTLATQAVNKGMSLEAIAALLGHRDMRMTLVYARISDRTIAEEYFRVTQAVEANYENAAALPADVEGANMRLLAADHRRLLGNGHCVRPIGLDCTFESICERCGFFETGPQFVTVLHRQRQDALDHGQEDRAQLLSGFLKDIDGGA
ncbi:MAG TPA: tyrosine-type recombinase/integrase [Acidimicrobiales bacterium]